ncbi:MAG: KEOPS complex subunit Cgi121 [Thermoplasmatota archaeon]
MKAHLRDFPDEELCAAGIAGPLSLEDVLFVAGKANGIAPLQVVRFDRVAGLDHLRSAALHAHRAVKEGRAHATRLEVEFTRYLSGERQIRTALEKMGVPDGAPGAIVVGLGSKREDAVRYFIHALGCATDEALLADRESALSALGVTAAQVAATAPEKRLDLALEAVAMVDLAH